MGNLNSGIAFQMARFFEKPLTTFAAKWLKFVREAKMKKSEDIFMEVGVLPVVDHYHQPMINPKKHLTKSLRDDRNLPGIDLNDQEQLQILSNFSFNEELLSFPMEKKSSTVFAYQNGSYESGDAEYLYNVIRYFKPRRMIEIGSGNSTLMARNAIEKNRSEDKNYSCRHICIEPYEQPWLQQIDVELIRERVENLDLSFFKELENNDILFIDSSHIIRPQGDVLFEFLEILPVLKPGVIIHIHDIFTPKDYLDEWIFDHIQWNEQYILEAFLTLNKDYRIIGALNYLTHHYQNQFSDKCPIFAKQPGREPGAFWIRRN
jgi:predicted O-methyltransferase YrrM